MILNIAFLITPETTLVNTSLEIANVWIQIFYFSQEILKEEEVLVFPLNMMETILDSHFQAIDVALICLQILTEDIPVSPVILIEEVLATQVTVETEETVILKTEAQLLLALSSLQAFTAESIILE